MLTLSADDLIGLLPPSRLIEAVERALRAQDAGQTLTPKRLHVDWRDATLLAMPSMAEQNFGAKLVSVVPGNAARGLPVTNGIMVLNDGQTGMPVALMNAAALTAQRTGAVGALGVKFLTPQDISSMGVIGCGVQGTWQAICACAVRPIKEVFAFARSPVSFDRFSTTVRRHVPQDVRVTLCGTVQELLSRTSLVVAATTSPQPVLADDPALLRDKHFISVGSFKPTMQELPDSAFTLARAVAVDSDQARHEVGDVIQALQLGVEVFHISDCVTGKRNPDVNRTTVYKTVGAAVYDLFVAQAFYQEARSRGLGREITL